MRSPGPHWDAIGTAVIRPIRPRRIGVKRILMQNRGGERTPSVATAMQGYPISPHGKSNYAKM